MAKIEVHAGDFQKAAGTSFMFGTFSLLPKDNWLKKTDIAVTDLEFIEVASEENVKKLGGTVGWGVAGGVLLGPVGLLAGLLAGGKKQNVVFVARFKDGRKLLASTDRKTYTKIQAALF